MSEYLTDNWILSIFITILLGAIGSGLWDTILKPIAVKIGKALFTALTFGARRARDKVYRNAAMGHHELPSLYLLMIALLFLITFVIGSQIRIYIAVYAPSISTSLVSECQFLEGKEAYDCRIESIKDKIMPISLFALFASVIIIFRFISINRTNLVTTYYQQCLKAVRPFISNEALQIIEQRYALMNTKDDYESIINDLKDIVAKNNASLPEPYAW